MPKNCLITVLQNFYYLAHVIKLKVYPLLAIKAHGNVTARVHTYTATALGRGRVASPVLGHLYHSWYSFYRRLSGPHDQSAYEEMKKNLHSSDTRD